MARYDTGLIRPTFQAYTSGLYNVRDPLYGAAGDGATDDTAAIQAAIDAAGSFNLVYLPPGTYLYTTLALNGNGLMLRGAGFGATFLKQTASGDGLTVNVGGAGQISNVAVADLTLGASADRTSGAALRIGYAGFVNVRNVRITNALGGRPYEPYRIDRASDTHFGNVRTQGCTAPAVLQPGSASSVIVEVYFDAECEWRSSLSDGMLLLADRAYSAGVCSLEGIHIDGMFYSNAKAGLRVHATVAGASPRNLHLRASYDSNTGASQTVGDTDAGLVLDASFDPTAEIRRVVVDLGDGWSSFNGNTGIFANRLKDFVIRGGQVRANSRHGIDLQNAGWGFVDATIIDNSRGTTDTSYGFQVGGTSASIVVASKFDNSDAQTQKQRGVNLGSSASAIDLSRARFQNQATATVPNINGGGAVGNTGIILPPGTVSAVKTGAYSATNDDAVVRCDTTASGFTVTLPRAANFPDREIVVKRAAGPNAVTIAATAGTVETTSVTTTPVRHRSDGTNWVAL